VQAAARRAATGVWGVPRDVLRLGAGAYVSDLALAVDAAGDAVAAWRRYSVGGPPGYVVSSVVQAAERSAATGAWVTPQNLSAADAKAGLPQVALDRRGDTVAVWLTPCGDASQEAACVGSVQAAARPVAAATWSVPQSISAPGRRATAAHVALDPAGDAVAVWKSEGGFVQAAVRPAATGIWSAPENLAVAGATSEPPQVALDAAGDAIVVYSSGTSVSASTRSAAGGSWSAPQELPTDGRSYPEFLQLELTENARGDAVAVWRRGSEDAPPAVVQASLRPAASGSWGVPETLSNMDAHAGLPQVALDAAGNALAVWQDGVRTSPFICPTAHCTQSPPSVEAALRPRASGTWSAPRRWKLAGEPQIAADSAGDALAVWVHATAHQLKVQAVARPAATGTWSAPQYVSAPPARCTVPRLLGLALAMARDALKENHCRTGRITHAYSQTTNNGRVLAQRPKPGTTVRNGARVDLVVSHGRRR
jgi:PASTA domain